MNESERLQRSIAERLASCRIAVEHERAQQYRDGRARTAGEVAESVERIVGVARTELATMQAQLAGATVAAGVAAMPTTEVAMLASPAGVERALAELRGVAGTDSLNGLALVALAHRQAQVPARPQVALPEVPKAVESMTGIELLRRGRRGGGAA